MKPQLQTIWLHPAAPAKPAPGQACNGCGVCCAAEPCPVARIWLRQRHDACRALQWSDDHQRYRCGLLLSPAMYLRWMTYLPSFLPSFVRSVAERLAQNFLQRLLQRLFRRWIALGIGCDSDVEVQIQNADLKP
ncbi:hypothetical protein [Undibacterium sp. Xuan67W]|uniref:hypothetical protein n=1 Tax=Undibacterium sp. Xuan67W TaxID=3413057 RepID=UPI003BF3C6A6